MKYFFKFIVTYKKNINEYYYFGRYWEILAYFIIYVNKYFSIIFSKLISYF